MKSSSLPSILMRKRCSKLSEPRVYAPLFEKHDVFHPDKNCNAGKVLKAFRTESTRSLRQKPCRLSVLHIFLEISKVLKFPMDAAGAGCSFFNRKWALLGAESLVFRRAHVREAKRCETAALCTIKNIVFKKKYVCLRTTRIALLEHRLKTSKPRAKALLAEMHLSYLVLTTFL